MAIVRWERDSMPPRELRGGAVAIGNFDGVHRGHAALIAELRIRANALGGPAVAVTFDPHPLAILAPERLRPLLTVPVRRAELLIAAGVDHVAILHTTPELLRLEPCAFLDRVVLTHLAARAVVEGFNFQFGRERAGTTDMLDEWGRERGIPLTVVQPYALAGQVVSSSKVRAALDGGRIEAAAALLGRAYEVSGVVGTGARRGRSIGFPTANLMRPETLLPADGVYAVRARLDDGTVWPAAANVGSNPTFGECERKVEVHLLGFDGDLYDRRLTVEFVARLRDTRPFASIDELIEQVRRDALDAANRLR